MRQPLKAKLLGATHTGEDERLAYGELIIAHVGGGCLCLLPFEVQVWWAVVDLHGMG